MIEAKLKGEGVELIEPEEPDRTNVVDPMTALKKSLGQEKPEEKKKAAPAKKARAAEDTRKQPGLKLPIIGGKQNEKAANRATTKPSCKRASPSLSSQHSTRTCRPCSSRQTTQ
jgi:hypothetical protein